MLRIARDPRIRQPRLSSTARCKLHGLRDAVDASRFAKRCGRSTAASSASICAFGGSCHWGWESGRSFDDSAAATRSPRGSLAPPTPAPSPWRPRQALSPHRLWRRDATQGAPRTRLPHTLLNRGSRNTSILPGPTGCSFYLRIDVADMSAGHDLRGSQPSPGRRSTRPRSSSAFACRSATAVPSQSNTTASNLRPSSLGNARRCAACASPAMGVDESITALLPIGAAGSSPQYNAGRPRCCCRLRPRRWKLTRRIVVSVSFQDPIFQLAEEQLPTAALYGYRQRVGYAGGGGRARR